MIESTVRNNIKAIASRYPRCESALMPALDIVQKHAGGYVSKEDLAAVADLLGIPKAQAYGVWSYYTMYNRNPVGKYHIQVDTNVPATLMGVDAILDRLKQKLGISLGQTTDDGIFTLSTVEDLGSCGTCPVVRVNDRYYENMTLERVDELVDALRRGELPDWKTEAHFGSDCKILLRRRGKETCADINTYIDDGGYQALQKALSMTPSGVVEEMKESNLRGRGGAGFPTGKKWAFATKDSGKPVYLICNADEGEPGTSKDRQIMEFDPHLLLEGMTIAGYAIGAELGFIYIRGEFSWIAGILDQAISNARNAGKLGNDIFEEGFDFDVIVHRGAGAYVCGEETALIESLEGKRGNPRLRPPFPSAYGLYGSSTIVNNVETLACVPYIIQEGAESFRKIGTIDNSGPKIFGVSGHVNKPGVFEYPLGTSLETILEAAGGVKGRLKAVIVGGLSVPILTAKEAQGLKLDYDSCADRGTMLGSGGIIVMNETANIPKLVLRTMRFYAHESCGKCIPCREGSHVIARLLERIVAGKGETSDIELVLRLCKTINGSTLCAQGTAFAMTEEAMINKFRPEFDEMVS
ncbi:MAG: NADH-quinone oxidoreductase subunit NuoF [Candidatus Binatia bacterium]